MYSLIQTFWEGLQELTSTSVWKEVDHLAPSHWIQLQEIQEASIMVEMLVTSILYVITAPLALASDTGISGSLGAGERTYYEFDFDSDGVTLRLTVTFGTIICYASDIIQNPNEDQGYVWKVTVSNYQDVFLNPDSLNRTTGPTLYVALEGVNTSNDFTLNSTTGDRRSECQMP